MRILLLLSGALQPFWDAIRTERLSLKACRWLAAGHRSRDRAVIGHSNHMTELRHWPRLLVFFNG